MQQRATNLFLAAFTAQIAAVSCALAEDPGTLSWVGQLGGNAIDRAYAIATDDAGNSYVTGGFHGSGDFDPGDGITWLTSEGVEDIFILKLDTNGELAWGYSLGGEYDDTGRGIGVDGEGNVYVTGEFRGTVDFDPGPEEATFQAASGTSPDIFALKFDPDGNFIWARAMHGSDGSDFVNDSSVDSNGNLLTTGKFNGTVDFDPGPDSFHLTSGERDDIFVHKLDSDGNFVWARAMVSDESNEGIGIAVDDAGNVYTTGSFRGNLDFDPGSNSHPLTSDPDSSDTFVQKLDTNGEFVWAGKFTGDGFNNGEGIAVDGTGNVHVTGRFDDTVDFDPGDGTYLLTSGGGEFAGEGIFVVKLDTNGDLLWAHGMGDMVSHWARNSYGYAIAVDDTGNVYTTGEFQGTVDFDPGGDTHELTWVCTDQEEEQSCSADIFLQILNMDGEFVWAGALAGPDGGTNRGWDIAVNDAGNFYVAGEFFGTVDFDPGPDTEERTASGLTPDAYVSKHASVFLEYVIFEDGFEE
ncbi:hypothetical protein DZK25_07690 [Wenzhouxiangella sp. 15181]|uniref:SBBP repeat-containing protein n=2 Tax=unclassified Wenzhouxiangella TaxID=2613841 RepID=UPI000E32607E|nr:SBBP repeat-containing protein [Wenzhouxiangella sp. 15181]RFF27560.1 hypothetical protein DZK25_07690 [Wenzhouxiangella sp. 15181]RFP69578.1 hypothetical protein DZK26_02955 [Wenzhouxiangella sp. 15190]